MEDVEVKNESEDRRGKKCILLHVTDSRQKITPTSVNLVLELSRCIHFVILQDWLGSSLFITRNVSKPMNPEKRKLKNSIEVS